jgi:hypothetical protein
MFLSYFRKKDQEPNVVEANATVTKEFLEMQTITDSTVVGQKRTGKSSGAREFRINSPIGVDPKAMAKAAAARIDVIEQEIALDLRGTTAAKIGVHPRANEVAMRAGFNRIAPPKGVELPLDAVAESRNQQLITKLAQYTVMPEMSNTLLLGDTNLGAVIEVKEINMSPAVEEAAVLYAHGQIDSAIQTLINAFRDKNSFANSEFNAYRMLFDLLRYKGDSQTFDRYAIDFAARFEKSAPAWNLPKSEAIISIDAIPTLDLGEMLDVSIVPILEQLKVIALQHQRMRLDAGNITNINYTDGFGCELLMRVLQAFENTSFELELVGAQHLFQKLRPFIQSKLANVSGHLWLLYLEMLRLQNQPLLFEDIAVKFAAVYEVSPPSWRAPSKQLQDPTSEVLDPKTVMTFNQPDFIRLSGEIKSNSDDLINQLAKGLHVSPSVVCDCRELRLISFEAAGRLLTALTAWSAELKTVEFKNLSNPIATLFVVLGIQHLAVVERRREA